MLISCAQEGMHYHYSIFIPRSRGGTLDIRIVQRFNTRNLLLFSIVSWAPHC